MQLGSLNMMSTLLLAMVAMMSCSFTTASSEILQPSLAPLILIPGYQGNQLEVKLSDDYHGSSHLCKTFGPSNWFSLWLNTSSLLSPLAPCFAERIRLEYNAGTMKFHNPPGIQTRVPAFGSTASMEFLDPSLKSFTGCMDKLIDALKAQGYKPDLNLFGAPYDFRYAPGPNSAEVAVEYLASLKSLIENSSAKNSNKPVIILAYSLGTLWTLNFLNAQNPVWKQRFISRFIAIGPPWGGFVQEMWIMASGYNEGFSSLNPLVLRDEQRSRESSMWMLPVPRAFGDRTLVIASKRNYSAHDMEAFFEDIGFQQGFEHYRTRVPGLVDNLTVPGVAVSLIYGTGVETPETLIYNKPGFDYQPEVRYGDGDGTVNLCSLTRVVEEWRVNNMQELNVVELPNKTHNTILRDEEAVSRIVQEVLTEAGPHLSR